MMSDSSSAPSSDDKAIATNRRAFHSYHILEKLEAGIELKGAEVKSIRAGRVSLQEAYARVENGQVILYALHILPYEHSRLAVDHDPARPRRLLLHKVEIHKLFGQVTIKGRTLIPLRIYLKRGRVKVELALATGKLAGDKRETLRRKTAAREAERAMADRMKRR